jgi:hypothetical protein
MSQGTVVRLHGTLDVTSPIVGSDILEQHIDISWPLSTTKNRTPLAHYKGTRQQYAQTNVQLSVSGHY